MKSPKFHQRIALLLAVLWLVTVGVTAAHVHGVSGLANANATASADHAHGDLARSGCLAHASSQGLPAGPQGPPHEGPSHDERHDCLVCQLAFAASLLLGGDTLAAEDVCEGYAAFVPPAVIVAEVASPSQPRAPPVLASL